MRAKTIIIYNRDGSIHKIVSNAGLTRNCRAAHELQRNNVQPTFAMKLRRFVRRLCLTIQHYAEEAQHNRHHPAALMPYIGIEDVHEL